MAKRKQIVGQLPFRGKHLLVVEAILEYEESGYAKDVVFVEIHENMKSDTVYRMQLGVQDLYEMVHGAKELFSMVEGLKTACMKKEGEERICKSLGTYSKYTRSSQFSSQLFYGVKVAALPKEKDDFTFEQTFYLNLRRKNAGATKSNTLTIGFNAFSLHAFIDRIMFLARRADEALFGAQKYKQMEKEGAITYE